MIWSVLAALIGLAELVDPEIRSRRSIDIKSLRTDASWAALYFLYVPALGTALAEATSVISRITPARRLVGTAPWGVQLGLVFAIAEAGAYAMHRAQHTIPVLWRIHSVHHSSESVRWWSAFRSHPLDTAMSHGVPILCAAAAGVAPSALVPYLTVVTVVTVLAHADVHVPRTWLSAVIVTPAFHRSHHEFERGSTNFARVLPLCDLFFRTASNGVGVDQYGATGGVPRHGMRAQIAWGFFADRRSETAIAITE